MSPRRSELRHLERHRAGLGALARVVSLTAHPAAAVPASPAREVVPLDRGRRARPRRGDDLATVVALAPYRARRRLAVAGPRRLRTGPA